MLEIPAIWSSPKGPNPNTLTAFSRKSIRDLSAAAKALTVFRHLFKILEPEKRDSLMTDTVEVLILDLLEWVERKDRSYQETMDAWRTSCPRLTVWEDANDRGLVETATTNGVSLVRATPTGLALLKEKRARSCEQ
jgi:hypothetical protein